MIFLRYFLLILFLSCVLACKPTHVQKIAGESSPESQTPPAVGVGVIQNKTAYTVFEAHCFSCHRGGKYGATDWGNISSPLLLDQFATNNPSRIQKGSPDTSPLLARTKHGPGDQSMPPSGNSFLVEDYLVIYNWIKNLPLDPKPPAPPPVNPPVEENAFTVVQTHCLNCHNGGGGPNWGNIQNMSQFIEFAYSGSVRIKPSKASESTIIQRMKYGPGDQSMPPGQSTLTLQQYNLVFNWIQSLPETPTPVDPGPLPPPEEMHNRLARSSGEKLRLGDRRLVASVMNQILGPSAKSTVDKYILSRTSKFGGACDGLNSYSENYPTIIRCNEPGASLVSQLVNVDVVNIEEARIPSSHISREGLRVLACKQSLLADNNALSNIIQIVKGNADTAFLQSTPRMTESDIKKMYRLFYPGRDPKSSILQALVSVSDEAQVRPLAGVGGNGTAFESWRYVALTICKAPDWQLE